MINRRRRRLTSPHIPGYYRNHSWPLVVLPRVEPAGTRERYRVSTLSVGWANKWGAQTRVIVGKSWPLGVAERCESSHARAALLVSLANTSEPLHLGLHGANRPSREGVVPLYDKAIALCRDAGFKDVLLRGDTDFSLTSQFDRWSAGGVRFVFGYEARANLVDQAGHVPERLYHELVARAERAMKTSPRTKPANVKDAVVKKRGFKTLRQQREDLTEFSYRPGKCSADYRVVALRKNLSVERGHEVLFFEDRYFFYITNDWDMSAEEVVAQARSRCNQENLIAQPKGGVRALHAPVNTLVAYMVMAALAWSLKAWCALLLPVSPRWAAQHNGLASCRGSST